MFGRDRHRPHPLRGNGFRRTGHCAPPCRAGAGGGAHRPRGTVASAPGGPATRAGSACRELASRDGERRGTRAAACDGEGDTGRRDDSGPVRQMGYAARGGLRAKRYGLRGPDRRGALRPRQHPRLACHRARLWRPHRPRLRVRLDSLRSGRAGDRRPGGRRRPRGAHRGQAGGRVHAWRLQRRHDRLVSKPGGRGPRRPGRARRPARPGRAQPDRGPRRSAGTSGACRGGHLATARATGAAQREDRPVGGPVRHGRVQLPDRAAQQHPARGSDTAAGFGTERCSTMGPARWRHSPRSA